jgi:hypothetical protein
MKNTYRVLVGELGGMRSFGRPKSKWKKNIKLILKTQDMRRWINSSDR